MKSKLRKDSKRQSVTEGNLAGMAWCREEFKTINFSDLRLNTRFMKTAAMLAEQPLASINQALGSWHDAKAAYRLFSNEKCTADGIRQAHLESTLARAGEHKRILV